MGLPGRVGHGVLLLLILAVVGGLAAGWRPTGTSSVAASESRSSTVVSRRIYLPLLFQNFAVPFLDDFSNPGSGWPAQTTSIGAWGYVNGEYRMQILQPNYELFAGHNLLAGDFQVRVSARSDTPNSAVYGLYFANTGTGRYVFEVDPWVGQYILFRWDLTQSPPVVATIINWTTSSAILPGTKSNLLDVTRSGTTITLFANGTLLQKVVDGTLGTGTVGMDARGFATAPPAEAFFDNFAFVTNAAQPLVARSSVRGGPALAQDGSSGASSIDGTGVGP